MPEWISSCTAEEAPIADARTTPFLSMVTDLSVTEDAITERFGKDCRYKIRRAEQRTGFVWSSSPTRKAAWMNSARSMTHSRGKRGSRPRIMNGCSPPARPVSSCSRRRRRTARPWSGTPTS